MIQLKIISNFDFEIIDWASFDWTDAIVPNKMMFIKQIFEKYDDEQICCEKKKRNENYVYFFLFFNLNLNNWDKRKHTLDATVLG